MAKAAEQTNVGTAQWASVRFTGYTDGTKARFMFNVFASDEDGRYIFGTAGIIREAAVSAAMDILAIAALIDGQGLSEGERQKLRELADAKPMAGLRFAD
jgi:hypothetical protein